MKNVQLQNGARDYEAFAIAYIRYYMLFASGIQPGKYSFLLVALRY
jgi:hypothetical protein